MANMKALKALAIVMMTLAIVFIWGISVKNKELYILKYLTYAIKTSNPISAETVLRKGNGILFVETTDRMEPPSLVLCAIESAARVYPDRSVAYLMKGLDNITTEEDAKRAKELFPPLSPYANIYLFPLKMDQLLISTPLKPWYDKVKPEKEKFWTHISADACRLALIWKYGGIYLDTDIISLRPIPDILFLAAESGVHTSNGAFGFSAHYKLAWQFMENFIQNYKGEQWGHQGPGLFTRVLKQSGGLPKFNSRNDARFFNVSYLHPQRFYPIDAESWRRYYEVWQNLPTFDYSYALHLWNAMNDKRMFMVPGSNTLVEHLYRQHCPKTYEDVSRKLKKERKIM